MKNLINSIKEAVSVPLKFHITVLILPALLMFYNGLLGIPLFILLFASLLFHEYAHVWMAQRAGLYVPYVITHGFGAAAMIGDMSMSDFRTGLKIAVAGPAGSFILAIMGIPLFMLFPSPWTAYIIYINLALGIFNLLPLFPSDGGRILYSILGMKMGGMKAIKIAVITSWVLCGAGIVVGLMYGLWWLTIVLVLLIPLSIQQKKVTEAQLRGPF